MIDFPTLFLNWYQKHVKVRFSYLLFAVDGGSVNAFLAAALARVMRVAVPIPAVASASVLHSAGGGGSVVDVVRPL